MKFVKISRESICKFSNIQSRLYYLSTKNNGQINTVINICPPKNIPSKSYTILLLDLKENKNFKLTNNELSRLDFNSDCIKGVLIFIEYLNHFEIYDIAIDSVISDKNKWRFKLLNEIIKVNFQNKYIWAYFPLNNPNRIELSDFYKDSGFVCGGITKKTPGNKILNEDVLSFYNSKNRIQQNYNLNYNSKSVNLFIDKIVCNKLKKYLKKDEEYAGLFEIGDHIFLETGEKYIDLIYSKNSLVKGDETVIPPRGPYNFHTHPESCYSDNSFAGWPSSADIEGHIIDYFNGLKIHFIISVEGIYSISLTKEFESYLNNTNDSNLNIIMTGVNSVFEDLENNRSVETLHYYKNDKEIEDSCSYNDNKCKEDITGFLIIMDFLNLSNNLTINDLLDNKEDFVLFKVGFKSWKEINNDGGLIAYY